MKKSPWKIGVCALCGKTGPLYPTTSYCLNDRRIVAAASARRRRWLKKGDPARAEDSFLAKMAESDGFAHWLFRRFVSAVAQLTS